MRYLRVMSRVLVSCLLMISLITAIVNNGKPTGDIYHATDYLTGILTVLGLLFMGGFYGNIEE